MLHIYVFNKHLLIVGVCREQDKHGLDFDKTHQIQKWHTLEAQQDF
jgi:hypothetical protein